MQAIEKAIQPEVTGARVRGKPNAPDNAGMGLHTTRLEACWIEKAPESNVGIEIFFAPVDNAKFAANKEWYKANRERLREAVEAGKKIHIDFGDAWYSTQGAIHPLLFSVFEQYGESLLTRFSFSRGETSIRTIVSSIITTALDSEQVSE